MGMPTGYTSALLQLARPPKDAAGPKPVSYPEVARRRHTLIGNAWSVSVAECLFRLYLLPALPVRQPQDVGDFLDPALRRYVSDDLLRETASVFPFKHYAASHGFLGSVGPFWEDLNPWQVRLAASGTEAQTN